MVTSVNLTIQQNHFWYQNKIKCNPLKNLEFLEFEAFRTK